MDVVIGAILSYLISLAANLRTNAIHARREDRLREQLEREDSLRKAIASARPLRDELQAACAELARSHDRLGVTPQERPLWRLLNDGEFQADLVEWFMAGGMAEGNATKERLLRAMELALSDVGVSREQVAFLKSGYFDALEKAVFASPILAHWRHQLSLDYLREQVAVLRRRAEEAAGVFSPEKQRAALDRYCEMALASWDIIDLSNLPEGDLHMATQKLLLRQLYMPLRIEVEPTKQGEGDEAILARLEEGRATRRHREAGHLLADERDRPSRETSRAPVGERLTESNRLVVLGDPGGGKSTMLRWMATAYLLRYKADAAFSQVPDTQTLPNRPWIPVLIRCRDLGEPDLCRCFTDFLTQHLNKTELLPEEAEVMRAVILDRIAKGEALLLVDGLDEISSPRVRMMFCQELERTTARYPDAPVVVTSRIVGYRDMPYRMGSGFEHGQIAELDHRDKDLFARRWVEVTEQHQSADEKAKRARELLDALHSSDRIERLTGNPMLLTTLALVKRKVGKLPNKRNKLYAEAVSVLLNWNPRVFEVIEEDEAVPQLEYLAFEMCRRGVQRLTDDEVLDLLDRLRSDYPNIRALKRREAHAFLEHLEKRSSILIKSGGIWQKNTKQEKPVWEFRHLTFQEYLAARALLDGRYPGRDKTKSMAEQVALLAGAVEKIQTRRTASQRTEEVEVPESWREALRLLVADCRDDDVDEVLRAILNPMDGEDAARTVRPRAVLAALCLADEPNVAPEVAASILATFARSVQTGEGLGRFTTSLERAGLEVAASIWASQLKRFLMEEFIRRTPSERANPGGLWAMAEVANWSRSGETSHAYSQRLLERLKSTDAVEVLSAALCVMEAMFEQKELPTSDLTLPLLRCFSVDRPSSHAAAWAFMQLTRRASGTALASETEVAAALGKALDAAPAEELVARRHLASALGRVRSPLSVPPLLARLDDPDSEVRQAVIGALAKLGDKQAVAPLLAKLDHPDLDARRAVIAALEELGDRRAVAPLLAKLDDPDVFSRRAVVGALARLGDKQAVAPLLAKLDDPDLDVRRAVVGALARLGDKQAIAPLLAKLDDPDVFSRRAVVGALARLGGKQAVAPLLAKLDDPDLDVRQAVIRALGELGDKQMMEPLIVLLEDRNHQVCAAAAAALSVLGSNRGSTALAEFLDHDSPERRKSAVEELVRIRGQQMEEILLSRDLDRLWPWLDPRTPIAKGRLAQAASRLGVTIQEARSRYESFASEFHLRFE